MASDGDCALRSARRIASFHCYVWNTRQPLPTLDRNRYAPASGVARGAYILADAPGGNPEVILIGSGSEVSLAVQAHDQLLAEGIRARVVSMPSWDILENQTQQYRDSVLPPNVKARTQIEQGLQHRNGGGWIQRRSFHHSQTGANRDA